MFSRLALAGDERVQGAHRGRHVRVRLRSGVLVDEHVHLVLRGRQTQHETRGCVPLVPDHHLDHCLWNECVSSIFTVFVTSTFSTSRYFSFRV